MFSHLSSCDSLALLDMQGVVGPGFRHVEEARVLVAQHRVVPQIGHPGGHQHSGGTEAVEEEQAVAVRAEAGPLSVCHHCHHGQEGEQEKLSDLSLRDQVPGGIKPEL